jgi:GWxTD domain-containing protein
MLFALMAQSVSANASRAQDPDQMARVSEVVMSREARIAAAEQAFDEGNYALVIAQADALLERWPKDEHGLILKASALLFGPDIDASEAGKLLRRLPRSRRKQADVEALELWKDYRHGHNFLPTIRERLQLGRARDLLKKDSVDPVANLIAGMMRVTDQRFLDNAARLGMGTGVGDLVQLLAYDAEAIIDEETGRIRFENRRTAAPDVQVTFNDGPMREASEEAVRYLIRATAMGPLHSIGVRYLVEAAIRGGRVRDAELLVTEYVSRHPDSIKGHLYLGLLRYMLKKDDVAEHSFDRALELMPEDEQHPWLHPKMIVSTSILDDFQAVESSDLQDFWAKQDREWSTPGNERMLEHMGRMAYVDIIWGRPDQDLRGWETEPGQIIVRYGFPLSRLQFQDEYSRFHILHYGHRYWYFEDMVKADNPIFYSPPANAYQGGRAVMANDWALIAREQFRDNPLTSDLDDEGKMEMVVLPTVFENEPYSSSGMPSRTLITPICIRGAAFPAGNHIRLFDREMGAPVPPPSDSTRIFRNGGCPGALSIHETDGRARNVSLEIRNGGFWSVGRFEVPAAQEEEGIRASDILMADLIVEYDSGDNIPEGTLVRNDLLIRPVAEPRYEAGDPIFVYAEAYELDEREGDILSVQAVLAEGGLDQVKTSRLGRLFGGRDDAAVSVSFEDEIRSKSHGRYLILETEGLDPGLYTLALRFTEQTTGRQAESSREIRID